MKQASGVVADGGRDLDHHLGDRTGSDAEHERGEAGLNADAPIQAPSTAGAPASSPSSASRRSRACRSCATGATIARPSVVLWSAKPTTSVAPSASEPTA